MVRETKKELEKKIEKERDIISEQLKQKTLNAYDIGRHVFDTVEADVKQEKESDKRSCFMKACERYRSTDNVLIRTAIGKKWAAKDNKKKEIYGYDYDHDDSLMSSIVMRDIILRDGTIKCYHGYEYIISCEEGGKCITYRGDTMNSWSTTLDEYLRRFGGGDDGYFPSLKISKKKWNFVKTDSVKKWFDFLSIPANYGKALPPYITEFLRVVYTIGNFIPVPLSSKFNSGRNKACQDYWDLTLLAIYNYYYGESNTDKWESLLKKSKDWLGESTAENAAKNWDAFVRKNYLQDFVNAKDDTDGAEVPDGGHFGKPKELWTGHFEGHFKGNNLPSTEEEFRSFFTNAAAWIMARGTRMMIALEEKMAEQKNSREDA